MKIKVLILSLVFTFAMTGCNSDSSKAKDDSTVSENVSVTENTEASGIAEETSTTEKGKSANSIFNISNTSEISLTSDDLKDGVWDTIITKTANGKNLSPQLEWEPVEGAAGYVVYMIDTSADNWMHWKSEFITETSLLQGAADPKTYIGPYPPSGKHDYWVYVFALAQPVEKIGGSLDNSNTQFWKKIDELDKSSGESGGNILAYGRCLGTYTHGD